MKVHVFVSENFRWKRYTGNNIGYEYSNRIYVGRYTKHALKGILHKNKYDRDIYLFENCKLEFKKVEKCYNVLELSIGGFLCEEQENRFKAFKRQLLIKRILED